MVLIKMGLFDKKTEEQKRISKKIDDLVGKRLTGSEYTKNKLLAKGIYEGLFIDIRKVLNAENGNEELRYDDVEKRIDEIIEDMFNLAEHEAGTKWMRIGTMLSLNSTEQMIGAGFKALIDQNKILIRQNEILRRQNELIIEKLSEKK